MIRLVSDILPGLRLLKSTVKGRDRRSLFQASASRKCSE
jgi:hypothetical protein